MKTKVIIDTVTNTILSTYPFDKEEVIVDIEWWTHITIDQETGSIVKYHDSSQWKARLKGLRSKKDLNDLEKAELAYLIWDTYADKQ